MLGRVTGDRTAGAGTRAVNEADHRDPVMPSHINDRKPGSVSTDMTNRDRDLAKRETGAVTVGSSQAARRARPVTSARFGTVVHRVVPAQLACRIGARARAGERDAWPAGVAIALGTFALVFSELIPVGLLADISGHLPVSVGTGGRMGAGLGVGAVFGGSGGGAQVGGVGHVGAGGRVRPRSLLTVVTRPVSRIGLVAAGAIFFANFAAYTYIGPLLHARAGLGASAITLVLLGFGLAGAAAHFTAGVTLRAHLPATLLGSGLLIACSALLLATVTGARPLIIALVAVWGLGFGAAPVAAQSWMARAVPASLEGGLALFVSALQGSLAAGSAVGGGAHHAKGPGRPLLLAAAGAAAGSLALLGRAGAAINAALAGSAHPAREQGP